MKPFDLEAAKRGEPLVTRDSRSAKFIAHVPEAGHMHRVIALIANEEMPTTFREDGKFREGGIIHDIFMAPKKRTVYVQIFNKETGTDVPCLKAIAFEKKGDAEDNVKTTSWPVLVVALPVEIEE